MAKNWKEIVMAKEQAKYDAYIAWHNIIKEALSDGEERVINDEDDEEFEGATEWAGSGQYVIDRIKLNKEHNEFELRARMVVPEVAEPTWILGWCFERAGLDGLLEKIVWD